MFNQTDKYMQPININVQVQLSVADNLMALLQPLVSNLQGTERQAPAPRQKKTAAKPAAAVENKPAQEAAPAVEAPAAEAVAEAPAEQPAPAADKPKELTEVDVRAAMDETRKRIEGEDYKSNTNGELRQQWHRKLTAWFKQQAAFLGADKPSELPTPEARASFIAICQEVVTDGEELVINAPY